MLARIYWIYTQLKSGARPCLAGYLRCFEMSRSTFKRDIEFPRDRLGAPVEYDPVGNGYYLTDDAFEMPAFWFDRRHLLMMLGACRQLAAMTEEEPAEVRRFRQRIEALLTMHYGERILELVSFATKNSLGTIRGDRLKMPEGSQLQCPETSSALSGVDLRR